MANTPEDMPIKPTIKLTPLVDLLLDLSWVSGIGKSEADKLRALLTKELDTAFAQGQIYGLVQAEKILANRAPAIVRTAIERVTKSR